MPSSQPLPAFIRYPGRSLLRVWGRFPKAPGYLYQAIERWGGRLADGPLECRLFNGARLRCDLRDHVQRYIYFFGAYEPIESYLFRLLLRPGMVVIDVGANVGQYTLIAAMEVGTVGEVHAFEPVPRNFERLVAHVQENGLTDIVRMNMVALWDRTDTLRLSLSSEMTDNAGSYTVGSVSDVAETVRCAARRLDDYVAERGLSRVDFIKIDVEGAEGFALLGAKAVLERWHPTMLVEINREACRAVGCDPEEIWEAARPYGYRMWAIAESAERCHPLSSLIGVDRANVIFHVDPLPETVTGGWSLKSVLRYHQRIRKP